MKLRTKLFSGLLVLFVVIALLATVGGYAVYRLDKSSENILKDNFASVEYVVSMITALDHIHNVQNHLSKDYSVIHSESYAQHKEKFDLNFEAQATNITEPDEAELVNRIDTNYEILIAAFEESLSKKKFDLAAERSFQAAYQNAKQDLLSVYELNRKVILEKNEYNQTLAQNYSIFIITLGLLSIGLTFVFILYFPIYITRPLERLRVRLQAVSEEDYSPMLSSRKEIELGQISSTFNKMVAQLQEHKTSSVRQLEYRKQRDQIVMNQLQEGVLILDEGLNVISINAVLAHLLNLEEVESWIGRYAPDMALKNNLMRKIIGPTLQPRSVDDPNLPTTEQKSNTRFLKIENEEGDKVAYQVRHQDFYINHKDSSEREFAGYIITIKKQKEDRQKELLQAASFINQIENHLADWKLKENDAEALQKINYLLDTTHNFNNSLNGRVNITNR